MVTNSSASRAACGAGVLLLTTAPT